MTALYETAMKDLAEITGLVKEANRIIAEQSFAIARMREALVPFAVMAGQVDDWQKGSDPQVNFEFSADALRQARAALALCEGKQS